MWGNRETVFGCSERGQYSRISVCFVAKHWLISFLPEKGLNQSSLIPVDNLLGIGSFFGKFLHNFGDNVLPGKSKLLTGFNEKLLLFLLGQWVIRFRQLNF